MTSCPDVERSSSNINHFFVLKRPGRETYRFLADNASSHKDWVMAVTKCLSRKKQSSNDCNSRKSTGRTPIYQRSVSDNDADLIKSKSKLLEEVLAHQKEIEREQEMIEKLISSSTDLKTDAVSLTKNPKTALSLASLTLSEDHGYSSSIDGNHYESYLDSDQSRQRSPSTRSQRSMSTVSAASSLCSIPEEERLSDEISPKILAEIEVGTYFNVLLIAQNLSDVFLVFEVFRLLWSIGHWSFTPGRYALL